MNQLAQTAVFQKASTTYFNSSLFFPAAIRREVSILYGFVRVADDYVDAVPQDADGFRAFRAAYTGSLNGTPSGNPIIDDFVAQKRRYGFEDAWVEAFLDAMEADLTRHSYNTEGELLGYVYGSAEVIGLFLCTILGLPAEARHAATLQGRAMQYINFIRDVAEDLRLGRRYLPLAGGLTTLSEDEARLDPAVFARFLTEHLRRFRDFQAEADRGYRYIPYRYRVAIRTARDMYAWTGRVIERRPLVVFRRQVKPSKARVLLAAARNAFVELFR